MSDIHITRELLRAVARGDLPPHTLIEYGYKHLMGMCGVCREEFAAFRRERAIKSDARSALLAFSAILQRQDQVLKDVGKRAQRDLEELLRLPLEVRLAKISRSFNRFRGAFLASLLLDESRKAMPGDLQTVQELAETAEAVLRRSPAGLGVADLSARSAAYLGNVSRMRGDVQAAEALQHDRDLYARFPDAWTQLRLAWLEGKISYGLGHLERAEELFLATRSGFIAERAGYDAAMVSIDLATIYTQQGRADEALRIAEEMHDVFKAEDVHREAVAALLLFQEAARQKALTVEKLRDLSEYLKAARGNPSLRFKK